MNAADIESVTGMEEHPVIPLTLPEPLWSRLTDEERKQFYALRRETLVAEANDPFRFAHRLEAWGIAERQIEELRNDFPNGVIQIAILGANRSSKTRYGVTFAMDQLAKRDARRGWCLQSTQATSRADQQSAMFYQIPAEWRPISGKDRGGPTRKIVWTQSGGFTEDTFVLPNRSQCWFKFYTMNVATVEGAELDFAWVDELVTPDWIEALRFRLITRAGILLLTFTPVEGYSPTVKEFLDNAITIEEAEAELLPVRGPNEEIIGYEKVPRVQISRIKTARVVYFHTADNPYGNYDAMKTELSDSPRERILMRAYGVATNTIMTQFPGWSDTVHIISQNKWRAIEKLGGTRLHFVDPCSGRNWFMIWVFVDVLNRAFIYREWPSYGHPGAYVPGFGDLEEWAVNGRSSDGERGPAQRELGWGLKRYIEEILRLENLPAPVLAEPPSKQRACEQGSPTNSGEARESTTLAANHAACPPETDSCGGQNFMGGGLNAGIQGAEAGSGLALAPDSLSTPPRPPTDLTTEEIFERWMDGRYGNATKTSTEESVTLIDEMSELGMEFLAAPSEVSVNVSARGGGEALRLINDALYYDKTKPIDHTNQPHLYVVETCPNVIFALKNWTGKDGQHGASKDPIDCLRMLKLCGSGYCDMKMLKPVRPYAASLKR